MKTDRREFLAASIGAGVAAVSSGSFPRDTPATGAARIEAPLFHLGKVSSSPVKIASVELLKSGGTYFVRSTSTDGAVGICVPRERIGYLHPILQQMVLPYFKGKDARELEALVDGVYVHNSTRTSRSECSAPPTWAGSCPTNRGYSREPAK